MQVYMKEKYSDYEDKMEIYQVLCETEHSQQVNYTDIFGEANDEEILSVYDERV